MNERLPRLQSSRLLWTPSLLLALVAASSESAMGQDKKVLMYGSGADVDNLDFADPAAYAHLVTRFGAENVSYQPATGANSPSEADGFDVVVISSSVNSANTLIYADTAVPVLNWEPFLARDGVVGARAGEFGFAADGNVTGDLMAIDIVDNTHYITNVLDLGPIDVTTEPIPFGMAVSELGEGVQSLAVHVDDAITPTQHMLLAIEEGAALRGDGSPGFPATAAERRVNFFAQDNTWNFMNDTGILLFDRSLDWLLRLDTDPFYLEVNVDTGEARIVNSNPAEKAASLPIDAYTISSASASLNPAGWNSLDDQEGENEFGAGWDEVNASSSRLTEYFLVGESPINAEDGLSLGALFGGTPPPEADFNGDGTVDGDDLTDADVGWNDRFGDDLDGHDFLGWQQEFGASGGGGSGVQDLVFEYTAAGRTFNQSIAPEDFDMVRYVSNGAQAPVPEPSTCLLLVAGLGLIAGVRRKGLLVGCLALTAVGMCIAPPAQAALQHQYTFNDATANDSVGASHGTIIDPNGIVPTGTAAFGRLVLSANNGANSADSPITGAYVDLPNFMISSLGEAATFEVWYTVDQQRTWARLFDFGTSNGGEDVSDGADMAYYAMATASDGAGVISAEIRDATFPPEVLVNVNDGVTASVPGVEHHVAMVWDGTVEAEELTLYADGVSLGTLPLDFGIAPGGLFDVNNWIGRSQWGDPLFDGAINELRIHDSLLSAQEVLDSFNAGPVPCPTCADPVVTLDRDTLEVTITNNGAAALEIKSYSLSSGFGALDSSQWTTLLDETTSSANEELAEQMTSGTATLGEGETASLGSIWIPSPTEDLTLSVILEDDSVWNTSVIAEGNGGSPFARGDLDFDGDLDTDDYAIFTGGAFSDLSGLSLAQAYAQGDLNGDGNNDLSDLHRFRSDFNAANGGGAFAAMIGAPEPATIALLALSGLALLACKRRC